MTKAPDYVKSGAITPDFLKVQEVAARLQLSLRTIYRLIDNGELPVHRISRSVRIHVSDFEQFVRARRDP